MPPIVFARSRLASFAAPAAAASASSSLPIVDRKEAIRDRQPASSERASGDPAAAPASRASASRYVPSARSVFPVDWSSPATDVRLRPTSAVADAPAPGSAASACRAANTDRCAASASSVRPTLAVSSASS